MKVASTPKTSNCTVYVKVYLTVDSSLWAALCFSCLAVIRMQWADADQTTVAKLCQISHKSEEQSVIFLLAWHVTCKVIIMWIYSTCLSWTLAPSSKVFLPCECANQHVWFCLKQHDQIKLFESTTKEEKGNIKSNMTNRINVANCYCNVGLCLDIWYVGPWYFFLSPSLFTVIHNYSGLLPLKNITNNVKKKRSCYLVLLNQMVFQNITVQELAGWLVDWLTWPPATAPWLPSIVDTPWSITPSIDMKQSQENTLISWRFRRETQYNILFW